MGYTNSPLVSYTKISPNKTVNRNHAIDTLTIHCYVGQASVESAGAWFAKSTTQASCNYMIGSDGRVGLIVEEKDRSWCSSSSSNDHRAITIECACDKTHPYAVNDKVYSTLIELCADICKRNNIKKLLWKNDKSLIGQVDKQNMTVHMWFKNKSCPGEYLLSRHSDITNKVNEKLGVTNPVASTPATTTTTRNYLMKGDEGAEVKTMQENLIYMGYSCGKHGADSDFGGDTDKAVRAFQDANGLTVDGKYGTKSKAKLEELVANKKKTSTVTTSTSNKIDTVKEVQSWANINYKSGLTVDGTYGANTKKVLVKILQTELNQTYNAKLSVDGVFGTKTKNACPTLKNGSKNDVVGVLQALLICNGYSSAYLDKDFGSATLSAVKSYQSKKGLTVDGIAGKNTFAKLCS